MRSLFSRLRLLTDDLDARKEIIGDEQSEDPNCNYLKGCFERANQISILFSVLFVFILAVEESYQTPKRIFINISEIDNKKLLISDYIFPDETPTDICDRIRELFSFEIKDSDTQIISIENFPRKFAL